MANMEAPRTIHRFSDTNRLVEYLNNTVIPNVSIIKLVIMVIGGLAWSLRIIWVMWEDGTIGTYGMSGKKSRSHEMRAGYITIGKLHKRWIAKATHKISTHIVLSKLNKTFSVMSSPKLA